MAAMAAAGFCTVALPLAGQQADAGMSGAERTAARAQVRSEKALKDWEFRRDHDTLAVSGWEKVRVPHDWAISGPFDKANDLQTVAVVQNGESVPSEKTGRTGGLPYMGKGCYRTDISVANLDGRRFELLFDGAMSEARVYINGEKVCEWPYGYNAFHCDITPYIHEGLNRVTLLLENRPFSSRWYPGAGLYRKVRLIETPAVHIPVWGVKITTPHIEKDYATVSISAEICGAQEGGTFDIETVIIDKSGNEAARRSDRRSVCHGEAVRQNIRLDSPEFWSPENPALYTARTRILKDGELIDSVENRFGVRTIEFVADRGFFLNGERRVIHGVCMHHDLGPLGAAVNRSALRHQIEMLKEMGCDAIRTSHNMPAEDLVELCDEMGMMMMAETFDEWDKAKCRNGYHRFFDEWAEKDIVNLVRHFRNNPSIIMWSIGNEVPTQWSEDGYKTAAALQAICHREDPTRPVTCGMDQFDAVVNNGFGAQLDIPGFNYKPRRFVEAYGKLPQNIILGSETASTVSSRGVYHLPGELCTGGNEASGISCAESPALQACGAADGDGAAVPDKAGFDDLLAKGRLWSDHQSSSYDTECCYWSNIPDVDFAADEDYPWMPGQFVWTGFDYLGEPSPYDTDSWPNHSSVFGIIDLASIPKDRFWLYRSQWRKDVPTLHLLPHWTWPGHEGENIPVVAYSSFDRAELFVNGISQGFSEKSPASGVSADPTRPNPIAPDSELLRRFRLIWPDVVYQPGEIRVVAYGADGLPAAEQTVRTAGKPYALKLTPYTGAESLRGNEGFGTDDSAEKTARAWASNGTEKPGAPKTATLKAGGEDLCYVNVSVVDRDGNPVPTDSRLVKVKVSGAGSFEAVANGDPTCLEPFRNPQMHLFSGRMTAIVRSGGTPGDILLTVTAKGLRKASVTLRVE